VGFFLDVGGVASSKRYVIIRENISSLLYNGALAPLTGRRLCQDLGAGVGTLPNPEN
jgi:hypothetical protein